jgi:group I intron endonuclease
MLLLNLIIIVMTIPLASPHYLSTILSDLLFIESHLSCSLLEVFGGLFQTTLLPQIPYILGDYFFMPEAEQSYILLSLIPIINIDKDSNKPVYVYNIETKLLEIKYESHKDLVNGLKVSSKTLVKYLNTEEVFREKYIFSNLLLEPSILELKVDNYKALTGYFSKIETDTILNTKLKTWLFTNKPVKFYTNSAKSEEFILTNNKNKTGIYLYLNNTNGKIYIGSAKDLRIRLRAYYNPKELVRNQFLIQKAIIKYGHINFSLVIIEYCNIENLYSREQYYIDLFSPEYNILRLAGSSLGYKHADEAKAKIIAKLTGSRLSKETKDKIASKAFGRKHAEETILKMIETRQNVISRNYKKVYIFLNDNPNILYKEFRSYTEASLYLNCSRETVSNYIDTGKQYKEKWILKSYPT